MDKKTGRQFDPYEEVEKKLTKLTQRIAKIKKKIDEIEEKTKTSLEKYREYVEISTRVISDDIIIVDWLSRVRGSPSGNTSYFDYAMEYIKSKSLKLKQIEELGLFAGAVTISSQIENVISTSKSWNLSFEEIASYLIRKLGKREARELVAKENIMEYYGKDCLSTWNELTK